MTRHIRLFLIYSTLIAIACGRTPAEETGIDSDTDRPPLYCQEDERVAAGECLPCAPGTTNEAGDDAYGEDTDCDAILCTEHQFVQDHTCTPCPQGQFRDAGDDASSDDTECTPCDPGTFDPGDYTCVACEPGSTAPAGATECTLCPVDTYEQDNECLPCPTDFTSELGATTCIVAPVDGPLSLRDYGFLFWPGNHWTTWRTYNEVQHVQTGYYGLAMNVTEGTFEHFGMMETPLGPHEAQASSNALITSLPEANITYAVEVDGTAANATQFLDRNGAASNPSEMTDMGRFMQQIEVPTVRYSDNANLSGRVKFAAMPRHFVLTQAVRSTVNATSTTLRIEIDGAAFSELPNLEWLDGDHSIAMTNADDKGWSFIIADQGAARSIILPTTSGGLLFESDFEDVASGEELGLSIVAIPTNTGGDAQRDVWLHPAKNVGISYSQMDRDGADLNDLSEATWDPERGLFVVQLGDLTNVGAPKWADWNQAHMHTWYNRHHIVLRNDNTEAVSIPFVMEGGNNAAFYITGGSPLFRDMNGEPNGLPIQISKNWHETPFWYHLYSAMKTSNGEHEMEMTFAHSKWGETHAAAHAQLSLIGWSRNQQWDESSLGSFGESVTYDPDLTLGRSMVDDVRPFLVDAGRKWNWTGNVGGANFLIYGTATTDDRPEHQISRIRTHYEYTGPNLTQVSYAGVTRDEALRAKITTQLGRTDDLVRVYYHLEYEALKDITYTRFALFQMAADRYGDNGFAQYAYGNSDGVLSDETITDHRTSGYAAETDRGIALNGPNPWVMLYDNQRTGDSLPEHLANVMFVVRNYDIDIGGIRTTTPHINLRRTFNKNWSQMSFELGIPYDASAPLIPKGSVLRATVEYLVPPAFKDKYYGESDYLTALDASAFQSTKMAELLATENAVTVTSTVGTVLRTHPIHIHAEPHGTAAQFTIDGGLGYTPVTITHLARADGWHLETKQEGVWVSVDQSVEGNDYWQAAYNAASSSYELTFNIHNRGTHEYRLAR